MYILVSSFFYVFLFCDVKSHDTLNLSKPKYLVVVFYASLTYIGFHRQISLYTLGICKRCIVFFAFWFLEKPISRRLMQICNDSSITLVSSVMPPIWLAYLATKHNRQLMLSSQLVWSSLPLWYCCRFRVVSSLQIVYTQVAVKVPLIYNISQ